MKIHERINPNIFNNIYLDPKLNKNLKDIPKKVLKSEREFHNEMINSTTEQRKCGGCHRRKELIKDKVNTVIEKVKKIFK